MFYSNSHEHDSGPLSLGTVVVIRPLSEIYSCFVRDWSLTSTITVGELWLFSAMVAKTQWLNFFDTKEKVSV